MFVWLLLFGLVLLKTSEVFIVANEVVRMNSLSNIIIKWIFAYEVSCVDFHTCVFFRAQVRLSVFVQQLIISFFL